MLICASVAEAVAPGWRLMGLSHLLLPQELLLRANLEEMRCAMPRAHREPPEQVRPRAAPAGLHGGISSRVGKWPRSGLLRSLPV